MVTRLDGGYMMAVGRKLLTLKLLFWGLANCLQGMGSASKAFRQSDCEGDINGHGGFQRISAFCV